MDSKRKRRSRGQIAVFVILVFQVLFILFAMTINVALVVHDKINFQNSLDLAAYYGASKQAEVLNAMAHINYQMRQNWKLLAWRYRILGTVHQQVGAPMSGPRAPDYWCPQNEVGDNNLQRRRTNCTAADLTGSSASACAEARNILPYQNPYCDRAYAVCISGPLWRRGVKKSKQNLCEKVGNYIPEIPPMPSSGSFQFPHWQIMNQMTNRLRHEMNIQCPVEGALNWLMAQFFLTHFRLDQRDRKVMLREIFGRSLKEGKDLDGNSIFAGVKKVFVNNLSQANQNNVKDAPDYGLVEVNSFEGKDFRDIFKPLNTYPVLLFIDIGGSNGHCTVFIRKPHKKLSVSQALQKLPPHSLHVPLRDSSYAQNLFNLNANTNKNEIPANPIWSMTLGFFKKPDKILYYGLKATASYKTENQLFSLQTGDIEFQASSFAKPFGGIFGPSPEKEENDPMIPLFHLNQIQNFNTALLQPNYSRYPGDKWGLLDPKLHDVQRSNQINAHGDNKDNFLGKPFLGCRFPYRPQDGYGCDGANFLYSMEDFFNLIFYSVADDPLARPPKDRIDSADIRPTTFIRMMELMAVYPDVYDISYYSIAGNYMDFYFPKICKLLLGRPCNPQAGQNHQNQMIGLQSAIDNDKAYVRGDFGWPETEAYLTRNQTGKGVRLSVAPYFLKANAPNINIGLLDTHLRHADGMRTPNPNLIRDLTSGKIFYNWLAKELPNDLLTSWSPTTERSRYDRYDFPTQMFRKCHATAIPGGPVPSACVKGGRSGYSVKLISCDIVRTLDFTPQPLADWCS